MCMTTGIAAPSYGVLAVDRARFDSFADGRTVTVDVGTSKLCRMAAGYATGGGDALFVFAALRRLRGVDARDEAQIVAALRAAQADSPARIDSQVTLMWHDGRRFRLAVYDAVSDGSIAPAATIASGAGDAALHIAFPFDLAPAREDAFHTAFVAALGQCATAADVASVTMQLFEAVSREASMILNPPCGAVLAFDEGGELRETSIESEAINVA